MRTNIRDFAFQVKILKCVKLLHGRLQGGKKINVSLVHVAVEETGKADPPCRKQHIFFLIVLRRLEKRRLVNRIVNLREGFRVQKTLQ